MNPTSFQTACDGVFASFAPGVGGGVGILLGYCLGGGDASLPAVVAGHTLECTLFLGVACKAPAVLGAVAVKGVLRTFLATSLA